MAEPSQTPTQSLTLDCAAARWADLARELTDAAVIGERIRAGVGVAGSRRW